MNGEMLMTPASFRAVLNQLSNRFGGTLDDKAGVRRLAAYFVDDEIQAVITRAAGKDGDPALEAVINREMKHENGDKARVRRVLQDALDELD